MASTLVSTLYPPLVDTFMPAFINTTKAKVAFSLSPYNTADKIERLHITIVDQTNNQNVLQSSVLMDSETQKGYAAIEKLQSTVCVDGVLIVPFNELKPDEKTGIYTIGISPDFLKKVEGTTPAYKVGQYYKVQLRFDSTPSAQLVGKALTNDYLLENRQYFSEWSSVCLIRPIGEVSLYLKGFERAVTDPTYPIHFAQGYVHLTGHLQSEDELLQSYRFKLIDGNEIVADSGIKYPQSGSNQINYLLSADNTVCGRRYKLHADLVTKNQYELHQEYWIQIADEGEYEFDPVFKLEENVEDGFVTISIASQVEIEDSHHPAGKLYVKRASSIDNFKTWELISCSEHTSSGHFNLKIKDTTVASMIQYKYSAQFWFAETSTWSKVWQSEIVYPTFYDIMLSRGDTQLAIRYNGQLTGVKQNIQRVKFDTLGSKYPKFAENAQMNYRQYSLSGLICAEGDFNRTFISELEEPYQSNMRIYDKTFGESYMLRNDSLADGVQETGLEEGYAAEGRANAIRNSLHDAYPHQNWYWERTFRDAVIEWLNDGEPKLFRSMPEGNMIVMVADVNLTPNQQIGRMLYNFTATLYEVGDGYSLTSLDTARVINVPNPDDAYSLTSNVTSDIGDYIGVKAGTITALSQTILKDVEADAENCELSVVFNREIENTNVGVRSSYLLNKDSVKFSNVKVQFTSPPQWWEETEKGLQLAKPGETHGSSLLGYVLVKDKPASIDERSAAVSYNNAEVFVNERGYYSFGDTTLTTLSLKDGEALVTYVATYEEAVKVDTGSDYSYVEETVLGQFSGAFSPDVWLGDKIKEKYSLTTHYSSAEGGGVKDEQKVETLHNIVLEVTPYAVVNFAYTNEDDVATVMIGRSGVYNISPDYKIDDLKFMGVRMVLNQNASYHELDSWEFRIAENNENSGHRNTIYNEHIYYNGKEYKYDYVDNNFNIVSTSKTIVAYVPVEGYITYLGDIIRGHYE